MPTLSYPVAVQFHVPELSGVGHANLLLPARDPCTQCQMLGSDQFGERHCEIVVNQPSMIEEATPNVITHPHGHAIAPAIRSL